MATTATDDDDELEKRSPLGNAVTNALGGSVMLFIPFMISIFLVPQFAGARNIWYLYLISGTVVIFALAFVSNYVDDRDRERELKGQADSASAELSSGRTDVKPAWDYAKAQLDIYFNQNVNQVKSIFLMSFFVIIVGFAVMVWGLYRASEGGGKPEASFIAAAGGFLTEFIGATFLLMYRSAMNQATAYAAMVERMNNVGMAMSIVESLKAAGSTDLMYATMANVATLLVQPNAKGATESSAPEAKQKT